MFAFKVRYDNDGGMQMNIIFLGAPGAGKGTQAENVSKQYGIPSLSTGVILREAIKNETSMGVAARSYVEAGKLVPDDIVIGISETDCTIRTVTTDLYLTVTRERYRRLRHLKQWV
jgi:adenylate kinase family enzyme